MNKQWGPTPVVALESVAQGSLCSAALRPQSPGFAGHRPGPSPDTAPPELRDPPPGLWHLLCAFCTWEVGTWLGRQKDP